MYDEKSVFNLNSVRFNMLFLLAGGGKFNYQGTKKWIEDNVESSGMIDDMIVSKVQL